MVGVARYDRPPDDPSTAEVAVLVEDAWQGVGLGRQLLAEVTALAARRGVRRLTATVQSDNAPALGLARRLLPGSTFSEDVDVTTVSSPVTPTTDRVPARPAALLTAATP